MKQISKDQIRYNNLKMIGSIIDNDMSKIILTIERLKEYKRIKYYSMDLILFNQLTHQGKISVSFWTD